MGIRVRFAPSPTGNVHIGNIRVAIFNWLFARHNNGKFLLRIEDTDKERSTNQAVNAVFDTLDWLNINFDEEPLYQSTRTKSHIQAAQELINMGLAYKEDKGNTGKGECIVFKMPKTDISYTDLVKGTITKKAEDLKDFVIVRSNGQPVFHLANVLDDIHMGITHIIRGDDHVENTFKHIALYKALNKNIPYFAHLPMIVNMQGKPYSKRDGAAFVGEFKESGFLSDALFNYLSFLGWNPGDEREKMSREELIKSFSLERVKSSASQMDIKKLTHLNAEYISELPIEKFKNLVKDKLSGYDWFKNSDEELFHKVCCLMQTRTHTLNHALNWKYFFSDEFDYDPKGLKKFVKKDGINKAVDILINLFDDIEFNEENIEKSIRTAEEQAGVKQGKMNQALRVICTGLTTGAGIYETLCILGKEKTLIRLNYAINNFFN